MADKLSFTELPLDILVLVFPYLDAKSFLALCSTCKAFQQPSIQLDPAYWSFATRSAFRIPNQPIVQHDGVRWQKMYRRLLTQSRVYTWGNNTHSRLGHSYEQRVYDGHPSNRMRRPGRSMLNTHCAFPTEMENTRDLGVIADMQCGGWSTTLLTSKGTLHTVGVLDGQRVWAAIEHLQPLGFPAGYPSSSDKAQYDEPTVAIRQFSAGRSHILAVSDSGRIWSWYHIKSPALQIKFQGVDINETATLAHNSSAFGKVTKLVAGWSLSSAYVQGYGIVLWNPVERDEVDEEPSMDTMLIMEHVEVPKTRYQRTKDTRSESDDERALGADVGAVLNYIMLEHFVVFVTDIGKVFCARMGEKNRVDDILELRSLRNDDHTNSTLDVQGSFRRFAVFKGDEVITSDQDYLEGCWAHARDNPEQDGLPGLHKVPALQHSDVISVAFGDYHYLALHSNGKITSYGKELQACGALGLGSEDEGQVRGIVYDRFTHDGSLLPHASTRGRQVWFDHKKLDWIHHIMESGAQVSGESSERRELFRSEPTVQGEVSEWIEQESRAWDDKATGEDGLGPYFALGISAAGWHSGALMLVNEELANQRPEYEWEEQAFPRLRLADGTEMPGTKDFDEWREGRPDWKFDAEAEG